jgi:hypothetical protein
MGDILHLVQIAFLLVSLGVGYEKLQEAESLSQANNATLNRVEHYLSSKDPDYWHRSKGE